MELGEHNVQGVDYAYTIHGWIKGVNCNVLEDNKDIGQDGNTNGSNGTFARDAFGYSLSYYEGDYTPINQRNNLALQNYFLTATEGSELGNATPDLWNGNIRHMVTSLTDLINDPLDVQGTAYKYDQLNRLTYMQAHVGITTNEWDASGTQLGIYGVDTITFDPNGNILSLKRLGNQTGTPIMDTLTYHYYGNTNRLEYVTDTVNTSTYSNDIDNQSADNYAYDPIGNLISDVAEGITAIEWYVNGKIKGITRSSATQSRPHLAFSYGPDGQRIRKVATWSTGSDTTWYVRDAQGNPMAVYWQRNDSLFAKEHYLYGSSRLGSIHDSTFVTTLDPHSDTNRYARTLGLKYFELSNHLGNVLATVSDQKISVEKSGSVEYYLPKVVSYSDYYPFGMQMEGRNGGTDYRFGFNSMEQDDDVKGSGNSLDFGARIYDPRLGRWLSVDPLSYKFPSWSPFNYAYNSPIIMIDPNGEEPVKSHVTTLTATVSLLRAENVSSLSQLREFYGTGSYGSNVGRVIPKRYIYSKKWGWIDLTHVSAAAYQSSKLIHTTGSVLDAGENLEYDQEVGNFPHHKPTSKSSAWDYEDLVSNLIGVGFDQYLKSSDAKGKDLTENFESYLKELGFDINPEEAENFINLPANHHGDSGIENYTYDPMYAPEKDNRNSKWDKKLLDIQEQQERKGGKDRSAAIRDRDNKKTPGERYARPYE